jgi:hypothetical protein
MPRTYTIHKPTHKFFGPDGSTVLAIGQLHEGLLTLHRFDGSGNLIEKAWADGSCAYHLTGYGKGVGDNAPGWARKSMQEAWQYKFGSDAPLVERCEVHVPS